MASTGASYYSTAKQTTGIFPRQLAVWQLLKSSLQEGNNAMLLYVLESHGSSPGRQGFAMVVNKKGQMAGSIGGGIMEHKFVEMAKEQLASQVDESSVRTQFHDKQAAKNQSGMICSGDQTILLQPLTAKDLTVIDQIIETLTAHQNCTLQLSPKGLAFKAVVPSADYEFTPGEAWQYEEKLGYKHQVYIIGGGHCALALSRLMSTMDFYIHLVEERSDLNTVEQNEFVHELSLLDDYSALQNRLAGGRNEYVVVMTFGYRTDDKVIRALLGKTFAWFGVLGSSGKIKKMFSDYIAEGIDAALLNKIEAPVGIQINSQTPEEIAVSVAASIIKAKNSR